MKHSDKSKYHRKYIYTRTLSHTYCPEQLQPNTEIMLEQASAFYLVLSQAPTDKSKMEAETADTTKYGYQLEIICVKLYLTIYYYNFYSQF